MTTSAFFSPEGFLKVRKPIFKNQGTSNFIQSTQSSTMFAPYVIDIKSFLPLFFSKKRAGFGVHKPKAPLCKGRLCCRPIVRLKGVTHYTMHSKACKKDRERKNSLPFCCRAWVHSRRFVVLYRSFFGGSKPPPYKVAAGKTCFMEGTSSASFFIL